MRDEKTSSRSTLYLRTKLISLNHQRILPDPSRSRVLLRDSKLIQGVGDFACGRINDAWWESLLADDYKAALSFCDCGQETRQEYTDRFKASHPLLTQHTYWASRWSGSNLFRHTHHLGETFLLTIVFTYDYRQTPLTLYKICGNFLYAPRRSICESNQEIKQIGAQTGYQVPDFVWDSDSRTFHVSGKSQTTAKNWLLKFMFELLIEGLI